MDLGFNHLPKLPSMHPQGSVEEPSPSFADPLTAAKQHSINASKPDIEEAVNIPETAYLKRTKASLTSLRFTVTLLLGVSLVLFSLCSSVRRVHSDTTVRRLADGDSGEEPSSGTNPFFTEDQWIPLDADELAELCANFGEWEPPAASLSISTPSIPMPDVDSTSEGHANESIGQAAQMPSYLSVAPLNEKQRPATRSPPRTDKRLSRADSDGYGLTPEKMRRVTYGSSVERDAVTKSSAVQHFGETVQQAADSVFVDFKLSGIPPLPTSVGHQQGQATSVASLQGAGQTQLLATPVLRQSPTIHPQTYALSTGITLPFPEAVVDPERPCASQSEWAPAGQTGLSVPTEPSPKRSNGAPTRVPEGRQSLVTEASSASRTKHPFVATPTLMPYVNIDDVVRTIEDAHLSAGPISGYLRTVRYMSLQPALSHLKAAQLVRAVLSLAKRALVSMTADIHMRASSAAESLGRRFLVIEAFHRFLKVTGDSNPRLRKVWNDLLANIPTTYDREPWGTWDKIRAFQHELSQNLSSALELYKNGSSPSEEEIINLKRKLFCMELSPRCFRSPIWDLWREDDREFSGAP